MAGLLLGARRPRLPQLPRAPAGQPDRPGGPSLSSAAFAALRTASQNNNIKLRDLAAQLVNAHERDELDAVADKLGLAG